MSPRWKATRSLSFSETAAQIQPVWDLARSGAADDAIRELELNYDLKDLPPFSEIAKYFGKAAGYSTRTDNGVLMKSFNKYDN